MSELPLRDYLGGLLRDRATGSVDWLLVTRAETTGCASYWFTGGRVGRIRRLIQIMAVRMMG